MLYAATVSTLVDGNPFGTIASETPAVPALNMLRILSNLAATNADAVVYSDIIPDAKVLA